jgi:D-3-phosphoglycerate dehydrogenase
MSDRDRVYSDRVLPDWLSTLFDDSWDVCGPVDADLAGCIAAMAGSSLWPGDRMDTAPHLKVISRSGIGFDTVDLDAATARGIVVCNTPDAPTISTAEHTMSLLMAAAKSTANNVARLREGNRDYYAENEAIELSGRTLGVVGFGRIGTRVARAAAALDMEVIVCDPYVDIAGFESVSHADIIERSDVITLHCPLTDETRNLLDHDAFAAMRDEVIIVNAARGACIDTEALVAALDSGKVYAAGLDVTAPEPLDPSHTLLHRDNVVITPHIASATDKGRIRMYAGAIANARQVLDGERPFNVVNPEVYEK